MNPYNIIFKEDKESLRISASLNARFPEVSDIKKKSSRVATSLMLCHVIMGISEAKKVFNEILAGIYEESNKETSITSLDTIEDKTLLVLDSLLSQGKETMICTELVDELAYVKKLGSFTTNLKSKYLVSFNLER